MRHLLLAALVLPTALAGAGGERPAPRPAGDVPSIEKIAPWVLERTSGGAEAEFLVVLMEQADLRPAERLAGRAERRLLVVRSLREKAESAQRPLLAFLASRRAEYRPFWIVNAVLVRGPRELALALAVRPDVARIEGNPRIQNLPARPAPPAPLPTVPAVIVETGVASTRAPEVWDLGFRGQGIVVGGQDTGYEWIHPALKSAYRGWNGSTENHDYNWHDSIHQSFGPCGANAPAPCDDYGHGTHTMGTAVGGTPTYVIGMAPGARWIGCRNMDQGAGTPATYLECMEFFLAPYPVGGSPAQGDPSKAPDVTVNSWSCPAFEGCSPGTLAAGLAAQRAAGILTAVAAENAGPPCGSVVDTPAVDPNAWTVGALYTGTDFAATFSSRGPVTSDGSLRWKPDIAAPGTNIVSSFPGGGYTALSGTSMAAPHASGAVALLWSAVPELKHLIGQTTDVLQAAAFHITASTCETVPAWPNNTFGYGRLDVKAAVDLALLRPVVSTVSPTSGSPGGGTLVTITGAHFAPGASVTIGGAPATNVQVTGPGALTASTGPHLPGLVPVTVSNPGPYAGALENGFAYGAAASGLAFHKVTPCRVVDTRNPDGLLGGPALSAGPTPRIFPVTSSPCGIPGTARALALNVTVTGGVAPGSVTVFPGTTPVPSTSSVSFGPARARASFSVLGLPSDGTGLLGAFNGSTGPVHLVLDVSGYFE